jgi:hypothetical protein
VAWEATFGLLAIFFVALGFLIDQASPATQPELEAVELAVTLVFFVEFTSRIGAAHDRELVIAASRG